MSKNISTLSAGNLVKLNENGVEKEFIFLQYNHYGQSEVTLLRKDTFAPRQWTASYNSSYNNAYNGSDMDMFCNTQYPLMLDKMIQACMVNVPIKVTRGATYGSTVDSTIDTLYRKCFLLSSKEATNETGYQVEGTAFTYLTTQANRIAYHDGSATAVSWWLRSPSSRYSSAFYVDTSGALSDSYVYNASNRCPRPALTLSSDIYVSDSVDSDGCYTIVDVPAAENYQKIDDIWRRMV